MGVKGGIFLKKMPLSSSGSGLQQFWNRDSRADCRRKNFPGF
jgi:hypothetical protein